MGRPFISYTQTGAWSKTIQSTSSSSYCPSGDTAFYTLTTGGGQPSRYGCFDRLGREVRTATQGFAGVMVYVDHYYDALGRAERVSEPYNSGSTRYWNQTAYDAVGRLDSVLAADGNDMTYDYDQTASACSIAGAARQVEITNGLSQVQLELRNALGEVLSVYDNTCGRVSYVYDAVGNITSVTGADAVVTTTTYDLAGRKITLNDPDKGSWQYAYNPLGELTRQLDGKSQAIDFYYDLLGRVNDRRELSGTSSLTPGNGTVQNRELTTWNTSTTASVKGKGQVTTALYRTGSTGTILHQRDFTYDSFGRPSLVSTTQGTLQLPEETTYDQFGRVFQQFDASGDDHGVRYHYNAFGYVEKLQEAREGTNGVIYQHIQDMNERGQVTYMLLGTTVQGAFLSNGAEAFATYAASSGRLQTLEGYDASGVELQFNNYTFDALGNIKSRWDQSGSTNLKETFAYDGLNRLLNVLLSTNGGANQTTLTMSYSVAGKNIWGQSKNSAENFNKWGQ